MATDPISDLLVRLQNGFSRRHDAVSVPTSRLKREILRILQDEGYIQGFQADVADGHPVLKVQLRYVAEGQPMVAGMQRMIGGECRGRFDVGKDLRLQLLGERDARFPGGFAAAHSPR